MAAEPGAMILLERHGDGAEVALVTLNRPRARNALCDLLMTQLADTLDQLETDDRVRVVVITGQPGVFAAGADIKEMLPKEFPAVVQPPFLQHWDRLSRCQKPVIAAVNGYALGGGCELAMMCDVIYASDEAVFGQPEITLGTIPGAGGTQRLCRTVGRPLAMEMCLTGRKLTAAEALQAGLVGRVIPAEKLLEEALKTASRIAAMSPIATVLCKKAVNAAHQTSLSAGLQYERDLFYATFATEDRRTGMDAFIQKQAPVFTGK
ncbi:enoyl-CoA hydratase, mitochondrial-like [Pollicipes pollicipes]|uniref:enoyl-CoA hydratase, mitochondrial-like n=1 Tax=Pollicipes pollicipes TaxID=41117 RepID=UPI0018858AAB|nr:enoyl-CoA hydratase, mitochondrial-like [Pollicipes pollicipes]